jgi:molybdate transport system permease protein
MDFSPVRISLRTTVCASLIVYILGVLFAWLVLKIRNRTVRRLADGILTVPLVLPPTVAGFILLLLFGNNRPIGQLLQQAFGIKVVFTWGAAVIAAVVVSFPLMYRSAKAGFEQINQSMIDEAKMLGLGNFGILRKILIPCTRPAIVSGVILSTTRGLGEFGATSMLAGNIAGKTRTLPLAIYSEVAAGNYGTAGVYVSVILLVAFAAVYIMNVFADQSEIRL